jgi:hypothetical protein
MKLNRHETPWIEKSPMSKDAKPATRRAILAAAAALAGLPVLAESSSARAAGTLPKANAKYQETPMNGADCAGCTYFIPGGGPKAPGACKVVAGPISATAWCILYAAKPH